MEKSRSKVIEKIAEMLKLYKLAMKYTSNNGMSPERLKAYCTKKGMQYGLCALAESRNDIEMLLAVRCILRLRSMFSNEYITTTPEETYSVEEIHQTFEIRVKVMEECKSKMEKMTEKEFEEFLKKVNLPEML